jgi:ribosomal protein S18 acetylase RimI-like enzyme
VDWCIITELALECIPILTLHWHQLELMFLLTMQTQSNIFIRKVNLGEETLIAEHFYKMWIDVGVPEGAIELNWQEIIFQFIDNARQNLQYQGFIAEVDRVVVGSTSCQLYAGLYPNAIKDNHRKLGYIWGVYVEPAYRRQGIAKQLTNTAIDYLKDIGCTRVVLNASPNGKPVYTSLGFVDSNAMHLDI